MVHSKFHREIYTSPKQFNQDSLVIPNIDNSSKRYKGHIPITTFQKSALAIGSAITSLFDPRRHDMIAILAETTGHRALAKIYSQMLLDNEGTSILADRPRISSEIVNLKELERLPKGTLGYAYTQFLSRNKVTPDSRLTVRFVDDAELAYVLQRYREVHDLIHTVLGMPTNMLGEVAVKWVEGLQTGLPMCVGGAMFGPIRLRPKQRQKFIQTILPWAVRVGRQAKPLMCIYFERRWAQELSELRKEFNIESPPKIKV